MWRTVIVGGARARGGAAIVGTLAGARRPNRPASAHPGGPPRPVVAQETSRAASWTAWSTSFLSTSSSLATFRCAFSPAFST